MAALGHPRRFRPIQSTRPISADSPEADPALDHIPHSGLLKGSGQVAAG